MDTLMDAVEMRRILPKPMWGWAYLWGIITWLLLIGVLYIVNVFVDLGEALLRLVFSTGLLLVGWGIGILVPTMIRLRPLQPTGWLSIPVVPTFVMLAILALWDVGPSDRFGRISGALTLLLLFSLFVSISWNRLATRQDVVPAFLSFVAIVAGGLALSYAVAGGRLDERLLEGLWRLAIGFVFASLVLLAPRNPRRWPVWLGWLAVAQFAVAQGLDPWVEGDQSGRLMTAGFVVLLVFGLTALIFAIGPLRRPRVAG